MKVLTTVAMAAVLWTVSDVSQAAQPATVKSIQPRAAVTAVAVSFDDQTRLDAAIHQGDQAGSVRAAGQRALQEIRRDAFAEQARQWSLQELTVPADLLVTNATDVRQFAVK